MRTGLLCFTLVLQGVLLESHRRLRAAGTQRPQGRHRGRFFHGSCHAPCCTGERDRAEALAGTDLNVGWSRLGGKAYWQAGRLRLDRPAVPANGRRDNTIFATMLISRRCEQALVGRGSVTRVGPRMQAGITQDGLA